MTSMPTESIVNFETGEFDLQDWCGAYGMCVSTRLANRGEELAAGSDEDPYRERDEGRLGQRSEPGRVQAGEFDLQDWCGAYGMCVSTRLANRGEEMAAGSAEDPYRERGEGRLGQRSEPGRVQADEGG